MDGSARAQAQHVLSGYKFGKNLGTGSFAEVKLAVHTLTGVQVAIKILDRQTVHAEKVRREINIMRQLCHPRLVRLFEVIDTQSHIYMVMEYMSSGDLFNHLAANILHEDVARHFFQQIISGIEYCHRHNVVHRDLKLENILLDSDNLKIADFGFANITCDGHFMRTSCGSLNYAAPELIQGKLYAGPEVDVWSCGVILYALLFRRLPFVSDSKHPSLHTNIKNGVYAMPKGASESARDLISRILVVDPIQRITIPAIARHPWFQMHLPLYIAIPSPGKYAKENECLNHHETYLRPIPSGKNKWTAGFKLHVQSQVPAYQLMLGVLWVFRSLNVKWKKIGLYNMKCLWQPPSTTETHSRKADAIKFEIQLYKTSTKLYVIDLQRLSGPPFIFLQICATFRALVV